MKDKICLWLSYVQKLVKDMFNNLKIVKDIISIYEKIIKPVIDYISYSIDEWLLSQLNVWFIR